MDDSLVAKFYSESSKNYEDQYKSSLLRDISRAYPANYFRLQLLLNSFLENGVKNVVEVGVGEGTPLVTLANAGLNIAGFDISQDMVEKTRNTLKANKIVHENIIWGDIQDSLTYTPLLRNGQFDGLIAMGVMPHVKNDVQVIRNMKSMVRTEGKVFIEFRNQLFSLFSFNRKTYEFILEVLLEGVSPELRKIVASDLEKRLEMDQPQTRTSHEQNIEVPGYDKILSKFHNPFEMLALFEEEGFKDIKLMWYHYHAAPPLVQKEMPQLFRDESMSLEFDSSGWKGMFLCSAFVIEATKK